MMSTRSSKSGHPREPRAARPAAARAKSLLAAAATLLAIFARVPVARADEASLKLPDLSQVTFLGGTDGRTLLMGGMGVCALGFVFGLSIYVQLRNLPVHRSMLEISELIYET